LPALSSATPYGKLITEEMVKAGIELPLRGGLYTAMVLVAKFAT
jgi:hypothetical protein